MHWEEYNGSFKTVPDWDGLKYYPEKQKWLGICVAYHVLCAQYETNYQLYVIMLSHTTIKCKRT